jgi:hypothetical protein
MGNDAHLLGVVMSLKLSEVYCVCTDDGDLHNYTVYTDEGEAVLACQEANKIREKHHPSLPAYKVKDIEDHIEDVKDEVRFNCDTGCFC